MSRHRRLPPPGVRLDEFERCYAWVVANREKLHGRFDKKLLSDGIYILDYIHGRRDEWPGDGAPFRLRAPDDQAPTTLYRLGSQASQLLQFAAHALMLDFYPHIGKAPSEETAEAGEGVLWVVREVLESSRRFDRIYYLYREWRNPFVESYFRGMVEMAHALGLRLDIRRFTNEDDMVLEVERIVDHHESKTPISVMFNLEEESLTRYAKPIARAQQRAARRGTSLFLTTTGYDRSLVHQNNQAIGERIADELDRDLAGRVKRNRREVLVIRVDLPRDTSPINSRKYYFESRLETLGRLAVAGIDVRLTEDEFYGDHAAALVRERVCQVLKANPGIVAVYAGYHGLAEGTLQALSDLKIRREAVSVYGDELTYPMLLLLSDPASHLVGICGIDAYHYGRYLLRIAATRSNPDQDRERERCPLPEPVYVTEADIAPSDSRSVRYPWQIEQRFPEIDVRLDDCKYRWELWMRGPAGGCYGPDLRQRHRR
ncbi:MAG: hypothetical protein AB7I30_03370 [Isosphaeraceae bacterium]